MAIMSTLGSGVFGQSQPRIGEGRDLPRARALLQNRRRSPRGGRRRKPGKVEAETEQAAEAQDTGLSSSIIPGRTRLAAREAQAAGQTSIVGGLSDIGGFDMTSQQPDDQNGAEESVTGRRNTRSITDALSARRRASRTAVRTFL